MNPHRENADLWSDYMARQWEPWLPLLRVDTTHAARWTGAAIAAACAPWLAFLTREPAVEEAR
jgi:hypothetical protein